MLLRCPASMPHFLIFVNFVPSRLRSTMSPFWPITKLMIGCWKVVELMAWLTPTSTRVIEPSTPASHPGLSSLMEFSPGFFKPFS
jgi:hypothetical protein